MLTTSTLAKAVMALAFAVVAARGIAAQTALAAPTATPTASAVPVPPPGPGLAIINDKCGACHSTTSVFGQRRTAGDWAATVQLMVDRGADLSPDEANIVIGYLAENFSSEPARPAAK